MKCLYQNCGKFDRKNYQLCAEIGLGANSSHMMLMVAGVDIGLNIGRAKKKHENMLFQDPDNCRTPSVMVLI